MIALPAPLQLKEKISLVQVIRVHVYQAILIKIKEYAVYMIVEVALLQVFTINFVILYFISTNWEFLIINLLYFILDSCLTSPTESTSHRVQVTVGGKQDVYA